MDIETNGQTGLILIHVFSDYTGDLFGYAAAYILISSHIKSKIYEIVILSFLLKHFHNTTKKSNSVPSWDKK